MNPRADHREQVLLFDGDCAFCREFIAILQGFCDDTSFMTVADWRAGSSVRLRANPAEGVILLRGGEEIGTGAAAIGMVLASTRSAPLEWLGRALAVGPLRRPAQVVYRFVAQHRGDRWFAMTVYPLMRWIRSLLAPHPPANGGSL